MIKGFNYGQLYSFVGNRYGKQDQLPKDLVDLIKKKIPQEMLDTARFSGTMANYMNLHEKGYGEHDEQWKQWQLISNRLGALDRLKYKILQLTGNMKGIVNILSGVCHKSYIYNFVATTRQLGVKNVEFTFNSHMPYRGLCTLQQSLDSLKYVNDNTNLTHVELENETYLATYIVGNQNNNENASAKAMQPFYDYIVNTVAPAVTKTVGWNIPMGLSIVPNHNAKFKAYNKIVRQTADKLKERGYDVYLIPHIYFNDTDEATIRSEIKREIDLNGKGFKYRVTEFNVISEEEKQSKVKRAPMSQLDVFEFYDRVAKIAGEFGIDAIFYHTIWTQQGTHYSFIK